MKLLVHFHLYYHNQVDYFIEKLSNIEGCEWDLYVTYIEENTQTFEKIKNLKPDAFFYKVNNIGYDVWPFIQVIQNINLDNYDFVLKIHTKRYLDYIWWPDDYIYKTKNKGFHWRNSLVEPLIGSKQLFKRNLDLLNNNMGFIADKSYTISIEKNSSQKDIENFKILKDKLGIKTIYDKFLAGTMFIIKSSILKRLLILHIKENDFDSESKQGITSSFAHTLERIFMQLALDEGYEIYLRDNLKLKIQYYFYKIITNIFSLRNSDDKKHKILTFLGIKLSFKR